MLKGIGTSDGIGIGKAILIVEENISVPKHLIENPELEKARFDDAKVKFMESIKEAGEASRLSTSDAEAEIILAQNVIINDPQLKTDIFSIVEKEKLNLEHAFSEVMDNYIMIFDSMEDELLKARASDFKDIRSRFLKILLNLEITDLSSVPENSVLIGVDITPSQAASIDKTKVNAIVIETGTEFSHIAILSKALQIPSIVGASEISLKVKLGDDIIVDGSSGEVFINPSKEVLDEYTKRQADENEAKKTLEKYKNLETKTLDNQNIELAANLIVLDELNVLNEINVDGIGLFRTEFLYMDNEKLPTEDAQFEIYKKIATSMGGKPTIIRTLDVGGDKEIPYLGLKKEENPFLGFRGIRFSLGNKDIFKAQLSALLRASAFGNIMIMLPMITSSFEIIETRNLLESVKKELDDKSIAYNKDIKLGIMVETPAAAIMADELAKHSDFFSLGTNDLTQYTLAVDRVNKDVAYLYDIFHPAVLISMFKTIKAANKANIMVGICGQAGADPHMVRFLIGAGIDEISVPSSDILRTKKIITETDKSVWEKHADTIIGLPDSKSTIEYIKNNI